MCILDVRFEFTAAATVLIDLQMIPFGFVDIVLLETLHRDHCHALCATEVCVQMYAFPAVKMNLETYILIETFHCLCFAVRQRGKEEM